MLFLILLALLLILLFGGLGVMVSPLFSGLFLFAARCR
jgi:hypothetical protein